MTRGIFVVATLCVCFTMYFEVSTNKGDAKSHHEKCFSEIKDLFLSGYAKPTRN